MPGLARVLLVEDGDVLAQPLLDALIDDGYEVVHAHDGAMALAAVRKGRLADASVQLSRYTGRAERQTDHY